MLPDFDARSATKLSKTLTGAGYNSSIQTVSQVMQPGALNPANCSLLVLPDSRKLPGLFGPALASYLNSRGHVIAFDAPAFQTLLAANKEGKFVPAIPVKITNNLTPPQTSVFDFAALPTLSGWQRSTNGADKSTTEAVSQDIIDNRPLSSLHVAIPNLSGWDTFLSPRLKESPFHSDDMRTVFWAKGDSKTPKLSVEWREIDGSRWIAVVPLSTRWQRISVPPASFLSWANSDARASQGFHPEHAIQLNLGLAFSHSGAVPGPHEYWIANIGVESGTVEDLNTQNMPRAPTIDDLCPGIEGFDVNGSVNITPATYQYLWQRRLLPASLLQRVSLQPRPAGAGFNKGRTWRWIPLSNYTDTKSGEWRGTPAALMVTTKNGVYASLTSSYADGYASAQSQIFISKLARRINDGLFLLDGGADRYTYFAGSPIDVGATVIDTNATARAKAAIVRITVVDQHGRVALDRPLSISVAPGDEAGIDSIWRPTAWPSGGYSVLVELMENGVVVDSVRHHIDIYSPPARLHWVSIGSDGHFHMDGHLFKFNGVNYMPSSGIAQPNGALFEHWMSNGAYDPVVVERDLTHIENLGLNSVYVFVYDVDSKSLNLVDFLRRCRSHRLKAIVSLRPGLSNALQTSDRDAAVASTASLCKTIIADNHLAGNDTVVAYEIDWEPDFGRFGRAARVDPYWPAWITSTYGNVSDAEKAWGAPVPRDSAGNIVGVSTGQLHEKPGASDGKLVAAYRRFLDDWLAESYGEVVKDIHSVAPHQFVSFRMTGASDGAWDGDGPSYQFEGLARAVDFLAPESYGEVGTISGDNDILFRITYGRSIAPEMPIIWAESGMSVWDNSANTDDQNDLGSQGEYYHRFYALSTQSGADGIFWWWYPGGFRLGENSDFGLINPDGTDRPATKSVRVDGAAFLAAPFPPKPNVWLDYNRDDYPDGAVGVFGDLGKAFGDDLQNEQHPGLRIKPNAQ
jgi:hypothetical protein